MPKRTPEKPWKPSREQLEAARAKKLRDVIAPGLDILFCGINPGLYSAATGHHFARPGNRFWPTLYSAGYTPRLFTGFDDHELLELGMGITNLAPRTTATADELQREELILGARALAAKLTRYRPRYVAMVGYGAWRLAFQQPKAVGGLQPGKVGGTQIWLLPNPSGLNANHSPKVLARLYEELRVAAGLPRRDAH